MYHSHRGLTLRSLCRLPCALLLTLRLGVPAANCPPAARQCFISGDLPPAFIPATMLADDAPPDEARGSLSAVGGAKGLTLAEVVLRDTQYIYSLVLLVTFIVLAAWYSVFNSKKEEDPVQPTVKGPGGKPLPITKRKRRSDGDRKIGPRFGRVAKNVFRYLAAGIFLSYVATGVCMFVHAFYHENPYEWAKDGLPWAGEWTLCHVIGSTFFYLYILFSLFDWRKGPNVVHLAVWILGFTGELVLFISEAVVAADCHFVRTVQQDDPDGEDTCVDSWTKIDLVLYFVRLLHLVGAITLFCVAWILKSRRIEHPAEEGLVISESTPLLSNGQPRSNDARQATGPEANGRRSRGRTISNAAKSAVAPYARKDDQAAFYRQKKIPHKTWLEYVKGYSLFFPYLWPKDSPRLQLQVLLCFVLVILQRLVNVYVPWQIGKVVNKLTAALKSGEPITSGNYPFMDFFILGVLWVLQGQSGLLGSLRSLLWIPVSQYSYRGLTAAAFNHVHSLSLDFHLSKRTGEVLSALNKGSAINAFLEQVTFQVIPMLFDLFLSITVFYLSFGALYAELNLVDTCWYLYMTIKMAATRADQRREMTNADREEEAVKNDSISSYETVKYFNAEEYESSRYRAKVEAFQKAEAQVQHGMVMMNICQTFVFNLGRIVAALVCGYQVLIGMRTTGDWFVVVSYLTQLQGPLNFFGSFYRTVQQAMISGERLLELFKIQPTVVDSPNAVPLEYFSGHVRWKNVSFSYDSRRPALRNISFECAPGTTTAFVGESGGGKSTLFRHMFRYYDCDEGSIEFDGKNVRDLTIDSVRRHIGVVPQDTTLFNETLMYNLKYANPQATDKEVYNACKAASIHDRIMSFPDGYNTQVGERGLRLSGGEKQRVAIARTILKDPRVIMLDEATSALDSHTEQAIQKNVCSIGKGRTLLIIAHRLSTITHADQIIVLHAGTIVERGNHQDLLAAKGVYYSMWKKQVTAERALDAAREASLEAKRAMRVAHMDGKNKTQLDGYESHGSATEHVGAASQGQDDVDAHPSASSSDNESTHEENQEQQQRQEPEQERPRDSQ
ncbi:Heavy metal tolerance protein [Trichoderma ghanense]|uniref:Heavy metal tolerance protein n=1 Tax=Trichoderma ghanense TaxID=65468 RepID=A0ABY2H1R8_9HYPO